MLNNEMHHLAKQTMNSNQTKHFLTWTLQEEIIYYHHLELTGIYIKNFKSSLVTYMKNVNQIIAWSIQRGLYMRNTKSLLVTYIRNQIFAWSIQRRMSLHEEYQIFT